MPTANLDEIRSEALTLTEVDRAKLACDLVASLDGPKDIDAEQAWDIEICRRINEIESGKAVLLDSDDILERVKAKISN